MNKTKVIASVGPASDSKDMLSELMLHGVDVFRLNTTHADFSYCEKVIDRINEINKELNLNISIMLDLVGPTVQVGSFEDGEIFLKTGEEVSISREKIIGSNKAFSTTYPGFIDDVSIGKELKLDDGKIILKVISKKDDRLVCEIIQGGILRDSKSINVPGAILNLPFLGKEDKKRIKYAHDKNLDFLALSFVSNREDVLSVEDMLIDLGNDHLGIISKIENERALEEIDSIIDVSDAVMVARGDLGVELPFERLPGIQKSIIHKCHIAGTVSIVATEILSSMEEEIMPSRAEVSDLANAVLDGVDAVMLAAETTIGEHPLETLVMMERIIASSENDVDYNGFTDISARTEKQDITGNIAYSVADTANRLKANAIVTPTKTGYTARKISRFRPRCPILALSPDISTVKSLALYFGVQAIHVEKLEKLDEMLDVSKKMVKKYAKAKEGSIYILTGGYPFEGVKHTNLMRIGEI